MADLIYQNIHSNYNSYLEAFKHVLLLGDYPGQRTCLSSLNEKQLLNGVPLEEYEDKYPDQLTELFKAINGYTLYCTLTGKQIIKTSAVNEDFVVYVYAIYNIVEQKWLNYDELESILKILQSYQYVKPLPRIAIIKNQTYREIKNKLMASQYCKGLILPLPLVTDSKQNLVITIIDNPYYKENVKLLCPEYVIKELTDYMDDCFLLKKKFRTYLAEFANSKVIKLKDLKHGDREQLQRFIVDKVRPNVCIRVEQYPQLFKDMLITRINDYFLDFIIEGII